MSKYLAREAFTDPEVKSLEERLGRSLLEIPLREIVDVDSNIIQQKVAATVLQGAWDEAGFWKDIVRVEEMGNNEKMEIPIISMRDFMRRRGKVGGEGDVSGGGKYTRIGLDVSKENTDYYVNVSFKKRDIELQKWDHIEGGLRAAGARMWKDLLSDITKAYVDDAGTTQALGSDDRFTALTLLAMKLVDAGWKPTVCLIEANDYAQAITTQMGTAGPLPFITAIDAGPSAEGPGASSIGLQGLVGKLFGKIPLYVIGNDTNLASDFLLVQKDAGKVVGLSKDITVVDFNDPLKSLQGFRLEMRYDIKTGVAAAIGKVTGV